MKIKIVRPDLEYPLVHIHVDVSVDVDREDVKDILAAKRITQIGRWEPNMVGGSIKDVKALGLLEDEHVKPRKVSNTRPVKKRS